MWLHQAGVKNVVAFMGHYMSVQHQWILEGLGAKVYLFLDNNDPGRGGTRDAGTRLAGKQWVKVVTYPDRLIDNPDAQPDDCTPQEIQEQIIKAPNLYDPEARYFLGI
jgi:DNA primase